MTALGPPYPSPASRCSRWTESQETVQARHRGTAVGRTLLLLPHPHPGPSPAPIHKSVLRVLRAGGLCSRHPFPQGPRASPEADSCSGSLPPPAGSWRSGLLAPEGKGRFHPPRLASCTLADGGLAFELRALQVAELSLRGGGRRKKGGDLPGVGGSGEETSVVALGMSPASWLPALVTRRLCAAVNACY